MATFGNIFLIPTDGYQTPLFEQPSEIWGDTTGAATGGEQHQQGQHLISSMNSLNLGSEEQQHCPPPPPPRGCLVPSKGFAANPPHGVVTTPVYRSRSSEASLRSRKLPNVEHLLLAGTNGMQRLLNFRQNGSNTCHQVGHRQEGPGQQKAPPSRSNRTSFNERRFSHHHGENALSPVKGTGRGPRHMDSRREVVATGARINSSSEEGLIRIQSILVSLLYVRQERDAQRKQISFPKRLLLCVPFIRLGRCPTRETCNYAHSMDELQKKLDLRKTSLCKYWKKGKCENEDCSFAHGEVELQSTAGVFKTTICKYWRRGCCHSGQLCRHAHGEADLRPENLPPHLKRKKLLQQQCHSRTVGRTCPSKKAGVERGEVIDIINFDWQGHAGGGAALHRLCQMLREGGSVPLKLDTATGPFASGRGGREHVVPPRLTATKRCWQLNHSNSSEESLDIFASSASSSPRGITSSTSVDSSSLSSTSGLSLSPDHSFVSAIGLGLGGGVGEGSVGVPLPPPATSRYAKKGFQMIQEDTPSFMQELQDSPLAAQNNHHREVNSREGVPPPPPPGLMRGYRSEKGICSPYQTTQR